MDSQFNKPKTLARMFRIVATYLAIFAFPQLSFSNQDTTSLDQSLLASVKSENIEQFEYLLKQGANPNAIFGHEKWDWVMCLTASMENLEFLKIALKFGGDINLRSNKARKWESSPIHCAITTHNRDSNLDLVLASGANPNISNCDECKGPKSSPFLVAAGRNKYSKVYKMLEAHPIAPIYVEAIVRRIEKRTIDKNSDEFQWRTKVISKLRSLGYTVNDPYE